MLYRGLGYWLILMAFLFTACTKEKKVALVLPEHSALASDRYWGVVRVPYLRLNDTIENEKKINGVLRAGTVVFISEIRSIYQNSLAFWQDYYYVETVGSEEVLTGWISSDTVELFLYEEAAIRNSERFVQGNEDTSVKSIDILS